MPWFAYHLLLYSPGLHYYLRSSNLSFKLPKDRLTSCTSLISPCVAMFNSAAYSGSGIDVKGMQASVPRLNQSKSFYVNKNNTKMLVTFKSEGFVFKSSGSNFQQPAVQTFFVRSRVIEGLNGGGGGGGGVHMSVVS